MILISEIFILSQNDIFFNLDVFPIATFINIHGVNWF